MCLRISVSIEVHSLITRMNQEILFSCIFIFLCKPSFQLHACHDVVAPIVIQPFVIGQPLHVKFRWLSIFFILLRFLPLVVTFHGFLFQTLSRNSPGYISKPQHFDFNKRSVTNYCLKFSHARFVICYLKCSKDKDLKSPFDNYWSPHINILKIEMGFSANSSWTYDESNDQIFWFNNCLKTCQK